jgi:cytochrome c-type biogenesis protein CcmH/NrfG
MKPTSSTLRAQVRRSAEILALDSNDADAWHDLGIALLALEDRAGACAALRHALRIDAGRAGTCLALGELLFDCGWFDAAMELFDRATLRPALA